MYNFFSSTIHASTLVCRYYYVGKFIYLSYEYLPLLKNDTKKCVTLYKIIKGEIKRHLKVIR